MAIFQNVIRYCLAVVVMFPISVLAESYSYSSQHKELVGYKVIDAGDMNTIRLDAEGQLLNHYIRVIRLGSTCYLPRGGGIDWLGGKPGIALTDEFGNIRLAWIEKDISSVKVEAIDAVVVSCANGQRSDLPTDPIERMREISRRNHLIEAEIKKCRENLPEDKQEQLAALKRCNQLIRSLQY